jgi:hypothetical protein
LARAFVASANKHQKIWSVLIAIGVGYWQNGQTMSHQNLDQKTIYLEMSVRDTQGKILRHRSIGQLSLAGQCVTTGWFDDDLKVGKSITFTDAQVKQFKPNDARREFTVGGKVYIPNFIYIEPATAN